MTKDEVKQILRNYNSWRRGDEGIEEQPNPKDIGIAIDIAISVLSQPESVQKPLSDEEIKALVIINNSVGQESVAKVNVITNMVMFSANPKQLAKLLEMNNAPLYTHPVQKPLSDEEIDKITMTSLVGSFNCRIFARAIEKRIRIGE